MHDLIAEKTLKNVNLACSKDPQWLKRQELGLTERSSRSVARSAPFRLSRHSQSSLFLRVFPKEPQRDP